MNVKEWFADLGKLLFPNLCFLCKEDLVSAEQHICSSCLSELPFTNFHQHKENALSFKLKGRFEFDQALALVYFNTEGNVRKILHEIKYHGNTYLAEYMGNVMAHRMQDVLKEVDVLIPVPLHIRRVEERGYNQSQLLTEGMSALLDIPIQADVVKRIKYTETQTHKTRSHRIENMKNAFEWQLIQNKNILLVDDVITTGATLESLVRSLPQEWNNTVSVISLAAAINT